MLEELLISKKEIGKLKIALKNPLAVARENITQNPRAHNTNEIKNAIENISIIDIEEKIMPEIITKAVNYTLKDFFLYLHQTGLYNRQFKLWGTLSNISQVYIFELVKGLFKKVSMDAYLVYFLIEPKSPCIIAIINENGTGSYSEFKTYLSKVLTIANKNRLKGILYFTGSQFERDFIERVSVLTEAQDPISKYESVIYGTKDTRLNLISYKREKEDYLFEHIYPKLKNIKGQEITA